MRASKIIVGSLGAAVLAAVGVTSISHSSNATTLPAAVGVTNISHSSNATTWQTALSYKLTGLPANRALTIIYSSGISGNIGGSAQALSGSMSFASFRSNYSLEVESSRTTGLTANVTERVVVNGPVVTGDADIPSGASLKVYLPGSDELIDVPNGHFSIPTGE